jgi:hypothetical protein
MMFIINVQVLPCAVTVAATAARVTIYPSITSQVHSSCSCLLILIDETETVIVPHSISSTKPSPVQFVYSFWLSFAKSLQVTLIKTVLCVRPSQQRRLSM